MKYILNTSPMLKPIILKKYLFNRWFHHFIFWSVVITGVIILNKSENFLIISSLNLLILCALLPVPVYLHFYLLGKFFDRKKYPIYFILTILLILVSATVLRSLFSEEMREYNGLFTFTINMTIFLVIATGLKFLKTNFSNRIQVQQTRTMEFQSEMELIKSRLNPAFMKKILNHLYHLSLQKSSRVSPLILQFAGMLRHTIESPGKKEIRLSDELDYISKLLNLEEQISGHRFKVEVREYPKIKITPLLLVNLVEKILTRINEITVNPQSGEIRLDSDNTHIDFSIRINKSNDLKNFSPDTSAIQFRMRQSYPDRSALTVRDNKNTWTATIKLTREQPDQAVGSKR